MSVIIGLYGGAGVGKDLFAQFAESWTKNQLKGGVSHYQTSFAEPVYELASVIFGVTPEFLGERRKKEIPQWFDVTQEQLERARDLWNSWGLDKYKEFSDVWPKFEEKYIEGYPSFLNLDALFGTYLSPRQILQMVGTELGRKMIYTDVWIDLLKNRIKARNADVTFVTDIRFDNEAIVIRDFPGVNHSMNVEIIAPTSPHMIKSNHVSEAGVSVELIDTTFENKFTGLDNLEKDVKYFLNHEVYLHIIVGNTTHD